MPELPQRKVGIIACSGEEMPQGLVSRLAALKVLEELRPGQTVTICLPLFLAGGESDRAFARFYPTIAIDGCEKRCAYRATEQYSNRPAAGLVAESTPDIQGLRRLNEPGRREVDRLAAETATLVDDLLEKSWSRRSGEFAPEKVEEEPVLGGPATCSCGSGIPIQHVLVAGEDTVVVALPLLCENFHSQGKLADEITAGEMLDMVKIYNRVLPEQEGAYREALLQSYRSFLVGQA